MRRDVASELKELRLLGMVGAWTDLMAQGESQIAASKWLIEHLLQQVFVLSSLLDDYNRDLATKGIHLSTLCRPPGSGIQRQHDRSHHWHTPFQRRGRSRNACTLRCSPVAPHFARTSAAFINSW